MLNSSVQQPESPSCPLIGEWRWVLLLIIVTFLAYQPAWHGQPVWDDAAHMTGPSLRGLHGLARIWTEPGATQQYYPVVHSVFWLEYLLWGDSTLGYHLVNILLHVTAALLLLKILRTLQIPGAGLTAAIFALHPIQVESVAWITELKNTLSAVCYFGSALALLRFDRTRSKPAYAGALALLVLGLMAKSVIATLPAALLVVFWWQRGKLSWKKDVLPLIPFFAIGITAGLFTSWMEREYLGASGAEFNFSFVERCLIAGRAFWFYLGKLFWPADFIFFYPRWHISEGIAWQYLFPAAAALLFGLLWLLRRWRRGPLAAMLFFAGTLFPALGFVNVVPFRFSFVADHFQYLAGIGPIVLAGAGMDCLFRKFRERGVHWERPLSAMLLATLCLLTWRQSRMYTDYETLWLATLERNPDCWLAQLDLGAALYEKGQVNQGIVRFRASLALHPDDSEGQNDLGVALDKKGFVDEAIPRFEKALQLRAVFAEADFNLGNALLEKGRTNEAIPHFRRTVAIRPDNTKARYILAFTLSQTGQTDEGILELQKLLELEPENGQAHYNLGIALLQKGRINEAIPEFQKAAVLRPQFAEAFNNLGNAFLVQGHADEAIIQLQKALKIRPDYPEVHYNLGRALLQQGRADEAIPHFQKALALQPEIAAARKFLADTAWRMATSPNSSQRNGTKAMELAEQLDHLAGGRNPMIAAILSAAYAESGQFDQAVVNARRALQLATRQNNAAMIAAIQAQLNCYETGTPFRDTVTSP